MPDLNQSVRIRPAAQKGGDMSDIQPITSGPWYYCALVTILVGWPLTLDALLRWPSSYRKAGLHKWKWVTAALLSNLLFYPGLVFAIVYLFSARAKIRATKPRPIRDAFREARETSNSGGSGSTSGSTTGSGRGSTGSKRQSFMPDRPAHVPTKRTPVPCGACRATGRNPDGTVCTSCGGSRNVIGTF